MTDLLAETPATAALDSPLGGPALPSVDGIAEISEAGTVGRLVLRAGPRTIDALRQTLGAGLTGRINTATVAEGCTTLRLGPDEWLLLAEADSDPWLAARIIDAAKDLPVSLVDVSHRNAAILLSGPAVEAVLAVGCPLPLDVASFPVGRATRTVLAKAEIVLWRRGVDRFQLEVARSFAPYVVALLGVAIDDEAAIASAARLPSAG
ncbi:MAG: sarcosine oxidase subunit gamma [Hyphomicrobiaceae bacterium]